MKVNTKIINENVNTCMKEGRGSANGRINYIATVEQGGGDSAMKGLGDKVLHQKKFEKNRERKTFFVAFIDSE